MIVKNNFRRFNASLLAVGLLMAVTLGCGLRLLPKKQFDVQEACGYLADEGIKSNMVQKDNCGGGKFVGSDGSIKNKGDKNAYRITYGATKNHLRLNTQIDATDYADFEALKAIYLNHIEKVFLKGLGMPLPDEARKIIEESTPRGGGRYFKELKTPKFEKVRVESIVEQVGGNFTRFNFDIELR